LSILRSLVVPKVLLLPLVQRRSASEVTALSGERTNLAERLDPSQHELDGAVCSARSVAGQFVTGELDLVESQTALATPGSQVSGAGEGAAVVFGVIGGVERDVGVGLETLEAVPLESMLVFVSRWIVDCKTYSHVLEGEKGTVGAEEHVQVTGADQGVVGVLNDTLQDIVLGRADALVAHGLVGGGVAEYAVDALVPVGGRGVDCLLNVGAVEVDLGARRSVVACVDLTEHRVRVRASLSDVVDVEARVDLQDSRVRTGELVAGVVVGVSLLRQGGDWSLRRRELEVLLHVLGVATLIIALPDTVQERLVEVEQVVPVLQVRSDDNLLLGSIVCNDRVVDVDALEGHVGVIRSDEGVCNVWNVVAAVALTGQVEIPSLDTEGLNELLVEANELLSKLNFVGDVWCTLSEADADRLLDPHHVGEIDPCVRVLNRSEGASFPGEWTILGKQTAQGTAARAAVEPYNGCYCVFSE